MAAANSKTNVAGTAPDWISEWVSKPNGISEAAPAGSGWIAEHIAVATPKFSEGREDELRPWLYSILGSFAAYLLPLFAGGLRQVLLAILLQAFAIGAALAGMYAKYRQEEAFQEKRGIEAGRKDISAEIKTKRDELAKHRMELESSDAEQKKIEASTARESSRIDAAMHSALKKLGEELARERQTLHSRKVSLSKAEDDEKSSIQTNCAGRINALRNEIAAASAQPKAELAAELKKHQDCHLMSSLARYRISDADISGIGEKLTARLQRAGIYTAADASHYRVMSVDGIGHQKGATIKRWRDTLVHRVQGNLPNQLDKITEAQVRAKFASATTIKEGQVRSLEQQRDAQLGAVAAKFKVQKDPVDNALRTLDAENTKKCNEARVAAEKERSMSRTLAITATKAVNERLERAQQEIRRTEGEAGRLGYQLSLNDKKLSAYSQIRFTRWLWSQTKLVVSW